MVIRLMESFLEVTDVAKGQYCKFPSAFKCHIYFYIDTVTMIVVARINLNKYGLYFL